MNDIEQERKRIEKKLKSVKDNKTKQNWNKGKGTIFGLYNTHMDLSLLGKKRTILIGLNNFEQWITNTWGINTYLFNLYVFYDGN